jgi:sugar/nucleoside kinase (ribokinase family)
MLQAPLVAGVGHATFDIVGVVPRHLEPDGRADLSPVSLPGGGAVATALVTARSLGCRARFGGRLADDDFGRFARAGLVEAGVDCATLASGPGTLSPLRFVAVASSDIGRRVVYSSSGDVPPLAAAELDLPALLEDAQHLVIDGAHPEAQILAAESARARGVGVIVDASGVRGGLGELVGLADVLVASERFVAEVAPRGEVEDSLVELQAMGPKTVVITLGASGSIGLSGDELVRQPAHEVEVVDTSGAGDVFLGALAAALAQRYSFARAVALASAAAALSGRALGARAALPDRAELLAFLGWSDAAR